VDDARAEFSQQRSRLQAIATQDSDNVSLPEAAPEVAGTRGEKSFGRWGLYRVRTFAAVNYGGTGRVTHLLVDGEGVRLRNDSAFA